MTVSPSVSKITHDSPVSRRTWITPEELDDYFEKLGNQFFSFYKKLKQMRGELRIKLKPEQQKMFNAIFANSLKKYYDINGSEYIATVIRLGIIAYRLSIILTALRIKDPTKCKSTVYCSQKDFESILAMIKVLVKHSERIFNQLPQVIPNQRRKNRMEHFFDALPAEFNRQQYLEVAEKLSIPSKSAERFIADFVTKNLLHRDQHNSYKKVKP